MLRSPLFVLDCFPLKDLDITIVAKKWDPIERLLFEIVSQVEFNSLCISSILLFILYSWVPWDCGVKLILIRMLGSYAYLKWLLPVFVYATQVLIVIKEEMII